MNKTALTELEDKIKNRGVISKDTLCRWIEQLKEKEKQQIIEARENGFYSSENWIGDSEKYYNETYGN